DNRLAFLMRPEAALPPASPSSLDFFHAGGGEAEVEEVFRRILSADVSLDRCEIVCGSPPVAALVWEKALRHGWLVTVAHGVPASYTRPGRALLAFAEWVQADFAAGWLRRMLQSGDVQIKGLPSGRAALLLVEAEAAWGLETYRRS